MRDESSAATSPADAQTVPQHSPGYPPADVEAVCRHSPGYPPALKESPGAPGTLYVVGGRERLARLTAGPAVAVVGSERATDYGMEMARSLARGLAVAGVTVVSGFANGIAAAAHAGALETDGPTITTMAGGVDVVQPAGRRGLYERVIANGCAVAAAPCGMAQGRWGALNQARTVAALAALTIVVEADERPWELRTAHFAQTLGRTVAAIPGRVTSPASRGTNALLAQGAPLVRGAADALDLLYGVPPGQLDTSALPSKLRGDLRATLERVGAGEDTPGKLARAGEDPGETLLALAELELMGLLGRGDGGRYVPRQSLIGE
jgi:DNA processing protein